MMNIMATMPTMTMPNTQGRAFFQALTSMVRGSWAAFDEGEGFVGTLGTAHASPLRESRSHC